MSRMKGMLGAMIAMAAMFEANDPTGAAKQFREDAEDDIKEGDWYRWKDNGQEAQADGMIEELNAHLRAGNIEKITK